MGTASFTQVSKGSKQKRNAKRKALDGSKKGQPLDCLLVCERRNISGTDNCTQTKEREDIHSQSHIQLVQRSGLPRTVTLAKDLPQVDAARGKKRKKRREVDSGNGASVEVECAIVDDLRAEPGHIGGEDEPSQEMGAGAAENGVASGELLLQCTLANDHLEAKDSLSKKKMKRDKSGVGKSVVGGTGSALGDKARAESGEVNERDNQSHGLEGSLDDSRAAAGELPFPRNLSLARHSSSGQDGRGQNANSPDKHPEDRVIVHKEEERCPPVQQKGTGPRRRHFEDDELPQGVLTGVAAESWRADEARLDDVKVGAFSREEDAIILAAVKEYTEAKGWSQEEGVEKLLSARKRAHGAWLEIGRCLPHRRLKSIHVRATRLLHSGNFLGRWSPEEEEALKRLYGEHGPQWRKMSEIIGRWGENIKHKWRDLKLGEAAAKGPWSQEEMEKLCGLVKQQVEDRERDPTLRRDHGKRLVHDDLDWQAIQEQMGRRHNACITQWYYKLSPFMVANGEWGNRDDRRMLKAMVEGGYVDEMEVEWEALLDDRSGDICRKRWHQMKRHFPPMARTFLDNVELACDRFAPNLIIGDPPDGNIFSLDS
eukprot:TRINITY_DN16735_c0_g1_i1.p1 TRINITY_DN16735_c0_g1~~TRINITY_DN16735_c0_g1_i1.p1  ORF type:complete len:598 (+),score=92.14 TRINITY_DN16735_c0_g1_i1:441-2234(+)